MGFQLTNEQRVYLGLEEIAPEWDMVYLKAGPYEPESHLYFDQDVLVKQIISTENQYHEYKFRLKTRERAYLLPKTTKGKEKRLTASVLANSMGEGLYFSWGIDGHLRIGNFSSQTFFYTSVLEEFKVKTPAELKKWVEDFVKDSDGDHLKKIQAFSNAQKVQVKYKAGDFFSFKLSRKEYGFGRIILDITKLKKQHDIGRSHGLGYIMARPLLVKFYSIIATEEVLPLALLADTPALPSDLMMDNNLFYGEYKIIGHLPLQEKDFDFPISFGNTLSGDGKQFLQWGLIHLEKKVERLQKYAQAQNPVVKDSPHPVHNPYGYYGVGFTTRYTQRDIVDTIANGGVFSYDRDHFGLFFDLRNPRNKEVRAEIFTTFGLDPEKSYADNSKSMFGGGALRPCGE